MTTGEKIRAQRKKLGMSVVELAERVGKNPATIYRYEGDTIEMPASMLKPLADALDTSPDELMDWDVTLREVTEHEQRMNQVLQLVDDGISTREARPTAISCSRRPPMGTFGTRFQIAALPTVPDECA